MSAGATAHRRVDSVAGASSLQKEAGAARVQRTRCEPVSARSGTCMQELTKSSPRAPPSGCLEWSHAWQRPIRTSTGSSSQSSAFARGVVCKRRQSGMRKQPKFHCGDALCEHA